MTLRVRATKENFFQLLCIFFFGMFCVDISRSNLNLPFRFLAVLYYRTFLNTYSSILILCYYFNPMNSSMSPFLSSEAFQFIEQNIRDD